MTHSGAVPALFTPLTLRSLTVRNRLWLAPMCQYSATDGMPGQWQLVHLAARASGGFGLLVTEAAAVLPEGRITPQCVGLWSDAQAEAWRPVVDAVHERGAAIVPQLAHAGRKGSTYRPWSPVQGSVPADDGGWTTVGPSPVPFPGYADPVALDETGIARVVEAFAVAARRAVAAGFDGVEVHAGNGYLLDQFLRSSTNRRTDAYGGSKENRARLLLEVMEAVCGEIGADRVGLRLSPVTTFNDLYDDTPQETFDYVVAQLNPLKLAFLDILQGTGGAPREDWVPFDYARLRSLYTGNLILNNGYDFESAQAAVKSGAANAIAFGRLLLANPDLVERFRRGAPLNAPDYERLYTGEEKGYTDYPTLAG